MSYFSEAGQTTELKMMTSARSWDKSLRVTGEPLRSARVKSLRTSPIWRGAAQGQIGRARKSAMTRGRFIVIKCCVFAGSR